MPEHVCPETVEEMREYLLFSVSEQELVGPKFFYESSTSCTSKLLFYNYPIGGAAQVPCCSSLQSG